MTTHVPVEDTRARKAARAAGLIARKSWSAQSADNLGGFMIIDPTSYFVVSGFRYDLTAQEVIEFCSREPST